MLCYYRYTTLRLRLRDNGATTIRLRLQCWLLTVAGCRRSSSSFYNGTGGVVSDIPGRWRHHRRTADFTRWSARAPRRPPAYAAAHCLPLVPRSTYIRGRASTRCTRICTHTNTHCHSVFDLNIQWRRDYESLYYYWYLLFTAYIIILYI